MEVLAASLLLTLLLVPAAARAAYYEVATVAELGDALLAAASNGEDDIVVLAPGTYYLGQRLTYVPLEEHSLTLRGAGAGLSVLDGQGTTLLLAIDTTSLATDLAAAIVVEDIGFRGAYDPSGAGLVGFGVWTTSAAVALSRCEVSGQTRASAWPWGVAALVDTETGEIDISACVFEGNSTNGLVISSDSGTVAVTASRFIGNGATGLTVGGGTPSVSIEGNTFEGNEEPEYGGGLEVNMSDGTIAIEANTFSDNFAGVGGGLSALIEGEGSILLEGNTFTGNAHGYGYGGGADVEAWTVTARGNVFTGNRGADVAGMQAMGEEVTLEDNVFQDNPGSATAVLGRNVLFARNVCSGNGRGCGGVGAVGGTAVIANNIVEGNSCRRWGAGLGAYALGGTVQVVNNTIFRNRSENTWGGLAVVLKGRRARATVSNNIVWGNRGPAAGDVLICDLRGPVSAAAEARLTANDYRDIVIRGVNRVRRTGNLRTRPRFADPIGGDLRLVPGSPCIDRGRNAAPGIPDTDFSGVARILDGDDDGTARVDLGAYELVP